MDGFELPDGARQELDEAGFTIIPGPVAGRGSCTLGCCLFRVSDQPPKEKLLKLSGTVSDQS
jgi:hypothetical protein